MTVLAPIVLFVYNRPRHTRQTVEALLANELANESDLIIFADGAKSDKDASSVQEVREYIHSIIGFKSITINEQDKNQGLANSVIAGVTEVVNKLAKIIVLEDDMVTSPYFLRYMNDALEMYKDEYKIISIHAYMYPIKEKLPETFFIRGADCWGWATWKRGWDLFEPDGRKLLAELQQRKLQYAADQNGLVPYTKMLKDQIKRKIDSWAVRWYISAFLKEKLTLWPGHSLIVNVGLDGSGSHIAAGSTEYNVDLTKTQIELKKQEIEESKEGLKILYKYFKSIKRSMLRRTIEKIQYEYKKLAAK
jgi:glycosyltransferase involved in cell wall biosynthesis